MKYNVGLDNKTGRLYIENEGGKSIVRLSPADAAELASKILTLVRGGHSACACDCPECTKKHGSTNPS